MLIFIDFCDGFLNSYSCVSILLLIENGSLFLSDQKRELFQDLAPLLWNSFGTIAALLQVCFSVILHCLLIVKSVCWSNVLNVLNWALFRYTFRRLCQYIQCYPLQHSPQRSQTVFAMHLLFFRFTSYSFSLNCIFYVWWFFFLNQLRSYFLHKCNSLLYSLCLNILICQYLSLTILLKYLESCYPSFLNSVSQRMNKIKQVSFFFPF